MPDTPDRPKPGRRSTIASHWACAEIELACARGTSLRRVAERFGVSRAAVDRHMHGLAPDYRARLAELADDLDAYEAAAREVYADLAKLRVSHALLTRAVELSHAA